MTQYDKIAKQYEEANTNGIVGKYVVAPTFFHYVKNVNGKSVLDVACGEGYYTRLLKKMGSTRIVGTDISQKMIDIAKWQENQLPLGIEYFKYDATKMPKLDDFDIITAIWLLHYSKNRSDMLKMLKNISKNLKLNGKFYALIPNFLHTRTDPKYDYTNLPKSKLKEGEEALVSLFKNGKKYCTFSCYMWNKKTYQKCLKNAGFINIKFMEPIISNEGLKKFGDKFWTDYKNNPHCLMVEAEKQ